MMTMDTQDPLAPGILLQLLPTELYVHFTSLAASATANQNESITQKLLDQVYCGSLPPEVFNIWFTLVLHHSPQLLKVALFDQPSSGVWYAGLSALRRVLKGKRWKELGWDVIGGVDGICKLLDTVGAYRGKRLLKLIGTRLGVKGPEEDREIDSLASALLLGWGISIDTDLPCRSESTSRRPSFESILFVIKACSPAFITKLLSKPLVQESRIRDLLHALSSSQVNLLRNIATGYVEVDTLVQKQLIAHFKEVLIVSPEPYQPLSSRGHSSYPNIAPGVSFCLDLIPCLHEKASLSSFIPDYLRDTVKFSIRRGTPPDIIIELIKLSMPTISSWGDFTYGFLEIPSIYVKLWSISANPEAGFGLDVGPHTREQLASRRSNPNAEHEDVLQNFLISLIKFTSKNQISRERRGPLKFSELIRKFERGLSSNFARSSWLPLIKLLCYHAAYIQIDLDATPPCEKEWRRLSWDISNLHMLPPDDSRWLFRRISSMDLLSDTVKYKTIRYNSTEFSRWYGAKLLEVKWESESPPDKDDCPAARYLITELKKLAERADSGLERCEFVKRVIDTTACSSNVSLLRDVITWTRRYLRDTDVFRETQVHIFDHFPKALACVAFPHARAPKTYSDLATRVHEANTTLQYQVETALLAQAEPDYDESTSYYLHELLQKVLEARIKGIERLCLTGLGDLSDLENLLLHTMVPILLECERIDNSEVNDGGYYELNGPLDGFFHSFPTSRSALKLLDQLAKKRDEFWNELRISEEPAVATLENGWPRGLPVQHLLSLEWATASMADPEAAPYVSGRLKEILFCDLKVALQEIPDNTEGIGKFIDSLPFAISCYVNSVPLKEKFEKALEIWKHYTTTVSLDTRYIEALKLKLAEEIDASVSSRFTAFVDPPVLPSLPLLDLSSVYSSPVEWDPFPTDDSVPPSQQKVDSHKHTILDCRFIKSDCDFNIEDVDEVIQTLSYRRTRAKGQGFDIWKQQVNVRNLPIQNREALAVSAILYLDTKYGSKRLLSKSFPTNTIYKRYPPLYLSYEFLSGVGSSKEAVSATTTLLRKLIKIVPPSLLQDLASSLLDSLINTAETSSKRAIFVHATSNVMKLLRLLDQPKMAIDPLVKMILNLSSASAWHRGIMTPRLVKQLNSEDAENMVISLTSDIISALNSNEAYDEEEDEEEEEGEEGEGDGEDQDRDEEKSSGENQLSGKKKHVKITTIKMVAQLIGKSSFICRKVAAQTLRSLFSTCRHSSARVELVSSLFSLLQDTTGLDGNASPEIYHEIVRLSVATTGPSERKEVQDAEWDAAENNSGPLPDIESHRPLMELFTRSFYIPQSLREAYVRHVVLPILKESTNLHNRWMRIFLHQYGHEVEDMDFGPFHNRVVDTVLSEWLEYLPKDYLLRHRAWAMGYLNLPKLQAFEDEQYAKDPDWKQKTDAARHWSEYFQDLKNTDQVFSGSLAPNRTKSKTKIPDGITTEDLAEEYYKRAEIALRHPRIIGKKHPICSPEPLLTAIKALIHPLMIVQEERPMWRSILERIVADINAYIQSPPAQDRQNKPGRSPTDLPTRFQLQTWLLPCPDRKSSSAKGYDPFINSVNALIDECTKLPSCFSDLMLLKTAMKNVKKEDVIHYATNLGTLTDENDNTMAGCMKVELAAALLEKLPVGDREGHPQVESLLDSWRRSSNEWTRQMAYTEEHAYAQAGY